MRAERGSPSYSLLSFGELVPWSVVPWAILVGCLFRYQVAHAQSEARASNDGSETTVPDGKDGLPGLYRVGVPATPAPRLGTSLWLNYGYTEAQNGEANGHNQIGGSLAIGGAFLRYFAGSVVLDLRHDVHGEDSSGATDSGSVLDITPVLRGGFPIGRRIRLGAEGRLLFAGAATSDKLAPPAVDGRVLLSYQGGRGFILSGYGGVRTAHTGSGVNDAALLREGDRVSLGLSEYPAALMGLGASQRLGQSTELLVEATYDLLFGSGSPPAGQSPLRLGAGARQRLIPGVYLQGLVEVSPMGRAPSLVDDPLVPIVPRVAGILGLSVRFPDVSPRRRSEEKPQPTPVIEPSPTPAEPSPPVEEPPAALASLRVQVVDETGHPISDAKVKVVLHASATEPERELLVPLSEVNVYQLSDLPLGEAEVTIEAELLEGQRRSIELVENTVIDVTLKKARGVGSQLRGLVRAYSGRGLPADIRVEPGNATIKCDEKGEFVLDLPPGTYSVTIRAEGYVTQKRRLRVPKEGVTVLNADLQRKN